MYIHSGELHLPPLVPISPSPSRCRRQQQLGAGLSHRRARLCHRLREPPLSPAGTVTDGDSSAQADAVKCTVLEEHEKMQSYVNPPS